MSVPSDKFGAESRNSVVEFLRTELSMALISASIAEGQRKSGQYEAAKDFVADAEERYSSLLRFLLVPNTAKLMKAAEQAQFASALKRLRKKLDSLTV
jgi:hypothetical protein